MVPYPEEMVYWLGMDNPVVDTVLVSHSPFLQPALVSYCSFKPFKQGAAMVEVIATSKITKVLILMLIPKIALID